MATLKMLFKRLVISIQRKRGRAGHQRLDDINILVGEEGGHNRVCVHMCACTLSGKENFSQQQITVKWTRETEKRGILSNYSSGGMAKRKLRPTHFLKNYEIGQL